MDWTKEQKQAINEKDSNILVAAAAGSGKTAVLVERIIHKIIEEKTDIDKLLVVTFTNAAASEMRDRVLKAIYSKLEKEPDNTHLQKQITLLNKSNICTIDSFCLEIIRNNFYELDNISPNFRIADTTEIELLKQEALEELFDKKYEEVDQDFETLLRTYTSYRDDEPLKEIIQKIDTYIQSTPFPKQWLEEKIEMYNLENNLDEDFSKTKWGEIILNDIEEMVIGDILTLQEVEKELSIDTELDKYQKIIEDDIDKLSEFKQSLQNWDNAFSIYENLTFAKWNGKRVDSEIKDKAHEIRDKVKENYKKNKSNLSKMMFCNSRAANEDILKMYNVLLKLKNIIFEFEDRFTQIKREKNIVDFNDVEHLALELLMNNKEIANKYKEKFQEIAIDEYQDSNMVQEKILTSISKENNIFMVGDVKQSIYKFRQAVPELFLDKYEKYKLKEDKTTNDDLKIQLFKNFRSRKGVLDFTNVIFENLMSNLLENVDYTEEEFLNYGASYLEPVNNLKTELDVITINNKQLEEVEENYETEKENNTTESEVNEENEPLERIEDVELEAKFVANKIKELIENKFQVYDKDIETYRDITYKDIVILLRSTKSTANIYEQEILKLQMPVFSDASQQYLESIEIETIMSLLKIIDNPIQDIPLITVLKSNIGGFTDNDLVEIRLVDKYDKFYNCLEKSTIQVDKELSEKIQSFLDKINKWREEKEYLALDEFIWKIYNDTGFYNYVGLLPNGELRQANLKLLFEKAKQYEKASFKGLYHFIQFIEKLRLNSGDLSSAKVIGENDNVVRIMSIHKSKGLEFPVVFVSSLGKQFNLTDLNKNILLHQKMGLGVKYIDYDMQVEYDSLTKKALATKILTENLAEEMRVLYVALTRAKEKLILTGIQKQYEKKNETKKSEVQLFERKNKKINPVLIKKYITFLDWLLLVNEYEKESIQELVDVNIIKKEDILKQLTKKDDEVIIDVKSVLEGYKPNKEKIKNIAKILNYEYPNKTATIIPSKMSVSAIKQIKMAEGNKDNIMLKTLNETKEIDRNKELETDLKKPKFLNEEESNKITPAQRGTLIHFCLQNLDYTKEYDLESVHDLINGFVEKELITKQEAESINPNIIIQFTKSSIWKELKTAIKVEREKPFYIQLSADEIFNNKCNENILVQGVIDLFYINKENEIILVDYKTDYVEIDKELIEKYTEQLQLYKYALESAYGKKVDKCYIYSTCLGKKLDISTKI